MIYFCILNYRNKNEIIYDHDIFVAETTLLLYSQTFFQGS